MALTLAEIRAKLQAATDNSKGTGTTKFDSLTYPFWNIQDGEAVTLRFLPDADTSNPYFWIERQQIKLTFSGIKGVQQSKPCFIQVPCMEMWNEPCPILAEVRPWFKDPKLEAIGKQYWKKRNYLFQGFVRKDALNEEPPENPIRKFMVSPQLFTLVKAALMDPELEELPIHYDRGLDFQIIKGSKGDFADYATSKWSRKETALNNSERDAIAKYGLFDLKQWLPKKPTSVELNVLVEMFEASVDGQAYDPEKWGQYFKPYGVTLPGATPAADDEFETAAPKAVQVAPKVSAPVDDIDADLPWNTEQPVQKSAPIAPPVSAPKQSTGSRAEDILALIKNRQKSA